jgi:hypothetical protein
MYYPGISLEGPRNSMEVVLAVVGLGPKFEPKTSLLGRRNSVHAPPTFGAETRYNKQANLIFTRSC